MTDLAAAAVLELRQRRTNAAQAVARGLPLPTANAAIARWCSIAAWFGAALPDELRPYEGHQSHLDHAPPRTSARDWLRTIAQQLREDALAQLTRAEADPTRIPRARALLALDRRLSVAAGLPPIGADEAERKAA